MAINAADVKLMRAERNTDETDGGGMMTGIPLVSGDINNLWADISQNLQARGGVSLRKLFGAIRSANTDAFLGAGFMLTKDAVADNISTLLFYTGDQYDERTAAKDAIEQYVVLSTRSGLRPVGTQRAGQTSLVLYTENQTDAPEVGEVLFLISGDDQQPVKVMDVDIQATNYTYVNSSGAYRQYAAYEVVVRISQVLRYEFGGSDPAPLARHSTEVFKTQSNASAKYYGIMPLAADASSGDASVSVDSIFQPVVPTSTSEVALVDQKPGVLQRAVQPASSSVVSRNLGVLSGDQSVTLPTAWVPGSLVVSVGGSDYDESAGSLRLLSGVDYLSDVSINPQDGVLVFSVSGSRSVSVTYQPGVAVDLIPYTDSVEIGAGNRQLTYTFQLSPLPMPGSLRVDYQYLGKWYTLQDDGSGSLSGPGASGSVNYSTGSGSLSLSGEPDVGSRIIYTWAQSPFRSSVTGSRTSYIDVICDDQPVADSLTVSWQSDGVAQSEVSGSTGVLSNSAGYIEGSRLVFTPSALPTSDVSLTYQKLNSSVLSETVSVVQQTGGPLMVSLSETDLVPGSVSFVLAMTYTVSNNNNGQIYDSRIAVDIAVASDAAGNLVGPNRAVCGSIDSAAGTFTLDGDAFTRTLVEYIENTGVLGGWTRQETTKTLRIESQSLEVSYRSDSASVAVTQVVPLDDLSLVVECESDPILPGSLSFSVGGDAFVDRGDGHLYRSWNVDTSAGLRCGSVDYVSGRAELGYASVYNEISSLSASLTSCALGTGCAAAVTSVIFRTAASPLRASGLQFLARRATDGAILRATSDNSGVITGAFDDSDVVDELRQPGADYVFGFVPEATGAGGASGDVDSTSGVVEIAFTQPVFLGSLTYNAVAYSTLPQDPERLGLDPVRLPTNGTVPIFNDGYLVAVHDTQEITEASPAAGQVIDCGRTDLAQIVITDSLGALLAVDQYSVNLAAGTATLADPFSAEDADGNSLTLPLTISHRVEDRAVVVRASVTGELSLNLQLTHDYTAANSYVSGIVELGDLQSRIYNTFFQKVDEAGEYVDELVGDASVASYNDLDYPILFDNLGSVKDRWKLRFTGNTGFECLSEQRGLVGVGSINSDFSPINPATGTPYFTIRSAGWGGSWVSGNIVRFNTDAAADSVWAIRTVTPSNQQIADDSVVVEFMGDAD